METSLGEINQNITAMHENCPSVYRGTSGVEQSGMKRREFKIKDINMHHEDNLFFSNRTEQKSLRRELRCDGTSAEAVLWLCLKERKIEGMRWRRQFGVGAYILDFYCPQLRLCIELDGEPHNTLEGSKYDYQREQWLLQVKGIRTMRFENMDVFKRQDEVVDEIRRVTKELLARL